MHLLDETARPEWIDYNGHLYDGYYGVVFARAIDAFIERIGLTAAVREATRHTVYTLETHTRFLREVRLGAPLAVACQVLEADGKRVRVFLTMRDTGRDILAATSEQLLMSIDQGGEMPKAAPWLPESGAVVAALAAKHAHLPAPEGAGRSIAIRR